MTSRLATLRAELRTREMEALLVSSAASRRYISGFSGSAGTLLVSATTALLFTDARYIGRAAREAPAFAVRQVSRERPLAGLLVEALGEAGLQQLAFDARQMTVAQHMRLIQALDEQASAQNGGPATQPPTLLAIKEQEPVEMLRQVKDADELAALRQAVAIADAALTAVLPLLRPDLTERQAAWLLEAAMRERGADAAAFPIIVAAGRNAALPHAEPGETLLGSGQPIIIDMGAVYQGYHSDLTRTVTLGEPEPRFWEVYDAVLAAQEQAFANLRPGLTGEEADALARSSLEAAGMGEAFLHSLGHGVGLEIHEGPSLARTVSEPLRSGNVVSVEPGAYLEDWGGVRIEDLVLLGEDGCTVLSQAHKQPVLPI